MCVDQDRLFRDGLRSILSESDFPIVWETSSLAEATDRIKAGAQPDIILIEPRQRSGLSIGRGEFAQLRADLPRARIIILSRDASEAAADMDLDGQITKDISPEALIHYIALVLIGERVILASPRTRAKADDSDAPATIGGLTRRDVEILFMLSIGKSNLDIARRFQVSASNVKLMLRNLFDKLDCENRIQAAIWATRSGIFTGSTSRAVA
jgi:DNA-binding NarL/FixJ family response regulator